MMKMTEFFKSKYDQRGLQDLSNEVLLVSLGKNSIVFLAELKVGTAAIAGNSVDGLIGNKNLLSLLAACDVLLRDHILCADSSTFSLTAETASILLQGNNNLQINMPKSCTCILSVIGRLAHPT